MDLLVKWWTMVNVGMRASLECAHRDDEQRALCQPNLLDGVLSPTEARFVIDSTERAAARRGYTASRHNHYPTRDLPVASVEEALKADAMTDWIGTDDLRKLDGATWAAEFAAVVERAANRTMRDLVSRCGAKSPALHDGFVIKYSVEGQAGLGQHGDGGRYSATVALNPPRRAGVYVPPYAKAYPQRCPRRNQGDPTATCVDAEIYPDRAFAREPFTYEYPLLEYADMCPPTCFGQSCDELTPMERSGCPCVGRLCVSTQSLGKARAGPEYFDGGGTRFSSLRDATFFPDVGDAVVHGARLKHGGGEVTRGDRYVLAFFFDEELCSAAEKGGYDYLYTSVIVAVVVAPLMAWIAMSDFGS